jgi:hypothetical protein
MSRALRTVCIAVFSFWLPHVSAAGLEKERLALSQMMEVSVSLSAELAGFDNSMSKARAAADGGDKAAARKFADEARSYRKRFERSWRNLEKLSDQARTAGLNLYKMSLRLSLFEGTDGHPDLGAYLAIKRHLRHAADEMALPYLMSSWRAVQIYGERISEVARPLSEFKMVAGFRVKSGQSVILIPHNGGVIRGNIKGFLKNRLYIRELLPMALARFRVEGRFRWVALEDLARIEVIETPPHVTLPAGTPMPSLSADGAYSPYYVREGYLWRLHLAPDDGELIEWIHSGQWNQIQNFKPRVESLNPERTFAPKFGGALFRSCEEQLTRRTLS